ncbi:lipoprotein-anchoring transpeptidase ErfK/SrfK [Prauserella isguenensis]|uniref:Lipoprotein-anchoring transpeptidase ErfK/SrfK n=1 Tax=Prauserella isguenensis TaxID=1470180 RepID=A0A839RZL5_9PSEU|nr:lipoprotein-anchoring transpeptidase ErfK/SrfK [Prauserella isguenensis]
MPARGRPRSGGQSYRNVSHGCVNLSPADALEYYKLAQIDDPFEVRGSSVSTSAIQD